MVAIKRLVWSDAENIVSLNLNKLRVEQRATSSCSSSLGIRRSQLLHIILTAITKSLVLFIVTILFASDALAEADVKREITTDFYLISGNNLEVLSEQMSSKGPNGRWAQTFWKIDWSDDCTVTIQAKITIPKLFGAASLSSEDMAKFNAMMVALKSHEMQHVYIGIFAAEEIKRYKCHRTKEISDYWKRKNDELDLRTKHGKLDGVSLGI